MAINRSHLRKYRKTAHLLQRELAFLVGVHSQGLMSEIEAGTKRPGLVVELCCEIAFGETFRKLNPDLYAKAENEVFEHALLLEAILAAHPNRRAARAYVAALISRLGGANSLP